MMLFVKRALASWSVRIFVFCISSHLAYSSPSPSVESLNEQMERLELHHDGHVRSRWRWQDGELIESWYRTCIRIPSIRIQVPVGDPTTVD